MKQTVKVGAIVLGIVGLMLAVSLLAAHAATGFTPFKHAEAPTPTATSTLPAEYTRMVAPSNAALDVIRQMFEQPEVDITTTRPAFKNYLTTLVEFNTKLVGFEARMPVRARPDVHQLRQGVAQEIRDVEAILRATTATDWQAAVLRWIADAKSSGGAAQLVRADLGLPLAA